MNTQRTQIRQKIKNQISKCKITNQNSKIDKKRETTNHTNSTNKLKKITTERTEENKTHREHREEFLLFKLPNFPTS